MQKGIMQEIKDRLEEDVSSGELIAMGYRPATVYKAQRAWRDARRLESQSLDYLNDQEATEASELAASEEIEENGKDDSKALEAELETLRIQAEGYEARIDELEGIVQENEGLKEQLAIMRQETNELAHSRQRIRLLEANWHFSRHAGTKLPHQLNSAEQQVKERTEQRAELEQQVVKANTHIANLANENGQMVEQLRLWRQLIERLTTELQGVMPLKVWAGHPCSACRKPMSGLVSHDAAASLLQDFGHQACLEQQNSNLGKWLLGGAAAIYGVSRLR
jgi:DNA repair exonuclease SbcCD ATPase subunit